LILAVSGGAYYAATRGPAPTPAAMAAATASTGEATTYPAFPLRWDGDWQRVTNPGDKRK
jgi:hypothetical protein